MAGRICVFIFALLFLFSSCSQEGAQIPEELTVATFNVQSLFDDVDDGDEYSPYRKHEGWNTEKYSVRLDRIADLIRSCLECDIIFFQEVESAKVLADLLDSPLARRGYRYYAVAESSSPVSVGFISRHEPVDVSVHSVPGQRLVLRAEFIIRARQLIIYCIHAKSNLGDNDENRSLRLECSMLLNSLYSRDFPAPVIILGDFNSQPVLDCSDLMTLVGKHDSQTIAAQGSLPVVMDAGSADSLSFYDPLLSADNAAGADGTYFHEGVFYDYDRILAGATVCRTYECSVEIVDSISPGGLCPVEYDPQTGEGLSDHFPVKLTLSAPAHDN